MRLLPIGLLAGLLLASCQTAEPGPDHLARFFGALAFPDNASRLVRWAGPVRIAVSGVRGEDPDEYRPSVLEQTNQLATLSGLDMALVENGAPDANFTVVFIPTDRVGPDDSLCEAIVNFQNNAIFSAEIKVGTVPGPFERQTRAARIARCIAHEMMHAMGLGGHPPTRLGVPSVMVGGQAVYLRERTMTRWDALMVRVLYDERLEPGMSRDEAEAVAHQVIIGLLAAPGG